MKLNAILVEDNQLERQILSSYLECSGKISLINVYGSGKEALESIKEESVDVAFLDIEIPDINGISLAVSLQELKPDMKIVFMTGHTDYAANAYQIDAIDYLVKPINPEDIERAINKIQRFKDSVQSATVTTSKIQLKDGHNTYFINLSDIFFIERTHRKSVIHTINREFSTNESLSAIQSRLNPNFFRCHQGFIVNIDKIESISPIADRTYEIFFTNFPLTVTTTKRRLDELFTILRHKG